MLWAYSNYGSSPTVALFIYFFLILLFYLERKTASRRAGLSATAEFLVYTATKFDSRHMSGGGVSSCPIGVLSPFILIICMIKRLQ